MSWRGPWRSAWWGTGTGIAGILPRWAAGVEHHRTRRRGHVRLSGWQACLPLRGTGCLRVGSSRELRHLSRAGQFLEALLSQSLITNGEGYKLSSASQDTASSSLMPEPGTVTVATNSRRLRSGDCSEARRSAAVLASPIAQRALTDLTVLLVCQRRGCGSENVPSSLPTESAPAPYRSIPRYTTAAVGRAKRHYLSMGTLDSWSAASRCER